MPQGPFKKIFLYGNGGGEKRKDALRQSKRYYYSPVDNHISKHDMFPTENTMIELFIPCRLCLVRSLTVENRYFVRCMTNHFQGLTAFLSNEKINTSTKNRLWFRS